MDFKKIGRYVADTMGAIGLGSRPRDVVKPTRSTSEKPPAPVLIFSDSGEPKKMTDILTDEDKKNASHTQMAYEASGKVFQMIVEGRPALKSADEALDFFLKACDADTKTIETMKADPKTTDKAYALLSIIADKKLSIQKLYTAAKAKEAAQAREVMEVSRAREAVKKVGSNKEPQTGISSTEQPTEKGKETQPDVKTEIGLITADLLALFNNPHFQEKNLGIMDTAQKEQRTRGDENFTGHTGFTPAGAFVRLDRLKDKVTQIGASTVERSLVNEAIDNIRRLMKGDKDRRPVRKDIQDLFDGYFPPSKR